MSETAFIYSNIRIYRLCMNLLYKGCYYRRFTMINKFITGEKVTELCFGDTIIASYCRQHHISWKGYDIHAEFVERAVKKGFEAEPADICTLPEFEKADTCIISGSLYHFHETIEQLVKKMLACAAVIIISEPIFNLSSAKGIIGKLARSSANVKGSEHAFRYTEKTLLATLAGLSTKLGFTFKPVGYCSKDIIIVIHK